MRLRLTRLDAWLVVMTVIWGVNYSIIKVALRQIPPIAFNAVRLIVASALFLATIRWKGIGLHSAAPPPRVPDAVAIVGIAVVGQFVYQILFMAGLARTSVAN